MNETTIKKTAAQSGREIPTTSELMREMSYGKGTRAFWKKTLRERKYLLICFFLPALLMWLTYITMKVYPFGQKSVLVLDLNGQYVYFFEALRDIFHGGGSLIYSFRRALGGEFLGIIGYYLASPFSIIPVIFPDSLMTEALLIMFLIKTGLCGLTFGIYIEATRKVRNRPATVIFSTMYALSAYAVVMQHNTMWTDNLIWLPMILLGLENLIKYGKYKLYVITLALAVFSNFYIGYMMCIFVTLYFFFYYYSLPASERNPRGVKYYLPKRFAMFALFSLLAVAICAVMVWGSYYSLTFGKNDFQHPSYDFKQRFDFLDLASKMYFGSYDTVRPEGLPFVYCGMLTFILIPLYFFAKKVCLREKISRAFLCLVLILSFNGNTIDIFWHGMQKPNWLNYRYSFMLIFIFLVMAYKAFDEIHDIGYRPVIISASAITLVLFILQRFNYENLPDLEAVWGSLGFIIVYMLMLRASTWEKASVRRTAALILCIFVSFEAYAGALSNLVALDHDVVFSKRTKYREFVDQYQSVADWLKKYDNGFYRAEKTSHRKTNDNMALGLYGVSNSTSTLNAKIIDILKYYGIASQSHASKYIGGTEPFDAIFGIKYLISDDPYFVSDLYNKVGSLKFQNDKDKEETEIGIYENPYALSVVTGVNEKIAELDISPETSKLKSAFEVMNATVAAMLGEDEPLELFTPVDFDISSVEGHGTKRTVVAGHTRFEKEDETANVTMKFTATNNKDVLMFIPTDYLRETKLFVNGNAQGNFFTNDSCCICNLGAFEQGEEVTVKFELVKDNLYIKEIDNYFYTFDKELFTEKIGALRTSPFNVREYSDDYLNGTIHVLPDEDLIFTSIPYDEGWKVYANDESVETFEILGGLLAFRLSPGSYNLTMRYLPDCVVYGSMISCSAIVVFILICVVEALVKKKKARRQSVVEAGEDGGDLGIAELTVTPKMRYAHDLPKKDEIPKKSVSGTIAAQIDAEIIAEGKDNAEANVVSPEASGEPQDSGDADEGGDEE